MRVLIADDHPLVRRGLRNFFENDGAHEIVGVADDGRSALELIASARPDVIILDLAMPHVSGWEVLEAVRKLGDEILVIAHSFMNDPATARRVRALGANGYVLKHQSEETLLAAIAQLERDRDSFFCTEFDAHQLAPSEESSRAAKFLFELSPIDRQILDLLVAGRSSKEIGPLLAINFRTIDRHISALFHKAGLTTRAALVVFAKSLRAQRAR